MTEGAGFSVDGWTFNPADECARCKDPFKTGQGTVWLKPTTGVTGPLICQDCLQIGDTVLGGTMYIAPRDAQFERN